MIIYDMTKYGIKTLYICDIFNFSIFSASFPDIWKIARVAPIVKGSKPDDLSNYRPIYVLPVVSRLFEKLIYDQLYQYLNKHKYLMSHQSGLRSLHSVVTCLLKGTSDWYVDIDNGRYTAMIFIDLKKAFDKVDHQILLDKIQLHRITGHAHKWFSSIGSSTVESIARLLASKILISESHRDRA